VLGNDQAIKWRYLPFDVGSNRVLYRGYLLANLIALLHINIYATVRDLWSRNKVDMGEYGDLFASKEMVGMLASMMLLHPLETIKYHTSHAGRTSN
jgi:hypothetical protein